MKKIVPVITSGALLFGAASCDAPARPEIGESVAIPADSTLPSNTLPRLTECSPNEHDTSEIIFYPGTYADEGQADYMQRLASHLPVGPVIFFEASATCKMQDAEPLLPPMFFDITPDKYDPMDLHISGILEDGTVIEADCVLGGIAGSMSGNQIETFEPVVEKGRQSITVVCNDDSSGSGMTGPILPTATN